MGNHELMRAGGGIRTLEGAPDSAIARELRLPKSRSRLQLRRLPERCARRRPIRCRFGAQWAEYSRVRSRARRPLCASRTTHHVSRAQVLHEDTQRPAIGDGVMDRELQDVDPRDDRRTCSYYGPTRMPQMPKKNATRFPEISGAGGKANSGICKAPTV